MKRFFADNFINVIMEEGIFRGLFIKLGMGKYSFAKANWFAAFLFGIWHVSMPIKSVIDGQMHIIRIIVAQMLSLVIILVINKKTV